jgi:hypothetical protein
MYAIGLPAAAAAAQAASWPTVVVAALIILAVVRTLFASAISQEEESANPSPSLPFSWKIVRAFFDRRSDFFQWAFNATQSPIFRFNLMGVSSLGVFIVAVVIFTLSQNSVYAVSGEAGRRAVLGATFLDINEGFKVLSGAVSMILACDAVSDIQYPRFRLLPGSPPSYRQRH